mgnify:CR=1 FL=1
MSEELVYVDRVLNLGGDVGFVSSVDGNSKRDLELIVDQDTLFRGTFNTTIAALTGLGQEERIKGSCCNHPVV